MATALEASGVDRLKQEVSGHLVLLGGLGDPAVAWLNSRGP